MSGIGFAGRRLFVITSILLLVRFVSIAGSVVFAGQNDTEVEKAERNVAACMPPTSFAYLEIRRPGKLMDDLVNHPLRTKLESLSLYRDSLDSPQYEQFLQGVSMIEGGLDMKLEEALRKLTAKGIFAVADARTEGVAVLIHAEDEETLSKTFGVVSGFVRLSKEEDDDRPKVSEYRGLKVCRFDDARLAQLDDWLLISDKSELAKWIADGWLDGTTDSLAENPLYRSAAKSLSAEATASLWVDLNRVREKGMAEDLFKKQTDNPAIEALLGGLLETVRHSPYLNVALTVERDRLEIAATTAYDPEWIPESRRFFFGPTGRDPAPPLLRAKETLFTLSAYRDISRMWLYSGDLFDENVNDELAKANSNLTTLFSGKDFGEEILGAVDAPLQFVVTRQSFDQARPTPAIKLPAFAIVGRLREPETMRDELRRTFQSLIGFINITGAMNGQPQLDLGDEIRGDRRLVTATYVPDAAEGEETRINFNFSPSIAFAGDRFVIASTRELARELAESPAESPAEGTTDNTRARMDLSVLKKVLDDNRPHLVAQNMLDEGHDKDEAERQIEDLLSVLDSFGDATLRLGADQERLNLRFRVSLAAPTE